MGIRNPKVEKKVLFLLKKTQRLVGKIDMSLTEHGAMGPPWKALCWHGGKFPHLH